MPGIMVQCHFLKHAGLEFKQSSKYPQIFLVHRNRYIDLVTTDITCSSGEGQITGHRTEPWLTIFKGRFRVLWPGALRIDYSGLFWFQ